VSPTENPLLAFYSAPPCPAGAETTSAYRSHRLPDLYSALPDLSGN